MSTNVPLCQGPIQIGTNAEKTVLPKLIASKTSVQTSHAPKKCLLCGAPYQGSFSSH